MQRFILTILGIWLFTTITITVTITSPVNHPCLSPILETAFQESALRDLQTGIQIPEFRNSSREVSPDGNHRILTQQISSLVELRLATVGSNQSELIQMVSGLLFSIFWSADNETLFITDRRTNEDDLLIPFTYAINIHTGDITLRYDEPIVIFRQSPDRRYVYVERVADGFIGVIDTLTGDLTIFDEIPLSDIANWSLDNAWMVIHDTTHFQIIDRVTGQVHPQLSDEIEGIHPAWSEHSLWFARDNDIWQASLTNGSITLVYEDARLVAVSPDDRWRLIEDRLDRSIDLYDNNKQISYQILANNQIVTLWAADFSSDSRCMMIDTRNNTYLSRESFQIYDLMTMDVIFRLDGNAVSAANRNHVYEFLK